jgi:hypothetical protein
MGKIKELPQQRKYNGKEQESRSELVKEIKSGRLSL